MVLHSRKTVVFMCKVDFMPVQDFKRGKTPHLLSETFLSHPRISISLIVYIHTYMTCCQFEYVCKKSIQTLTLFYACVLMEPFLFLFIFTCVSNVNILDLHGDVGKCSFSLIFFFFVLILYTINIVWYSAAWTLLAFICVRVL